MIRKLEFFSRFLIGIYNFIMNFLGFGGTTNAQISNTIKVYVRTNVGEQVCVELEDSWTVENVKIDLATKLGTPKERLRIIFAGKELPNELSIRECDLGNQSILHAVRIEALPNMSDQEITQKHPTNDCDFNNPLLENSGTILSADTVNLDLPLKEKADCSIQQQQKLLCDASTVMAIQLSQHEMNELNRLKASKESKERHHFYVYCVQPCASVRVGKLRVRCSVCKEGAVTLLSDPTSWNDVLRPNQVLAACETPDCNGKFAEFFFKCRDHETKGDADTALVLYMIRSNLPGVPCLVCTDVASPVIVFECERTHVLCLECFVTYCVSRLNERQFVCDPTIGYSLPCPAGCPDSLVRELHHFKLMGERHYERYQRFGAEETLLALGGVLCPQPGCGQGILPDESCRRIKCVGGCGFIFCRDCRLNFHSGPCLGSGRSEAKFASGSTALDIDSNRLVLCSWDEASSITIQQISKPCPKCHTPIERSGGCMHMVCPRASCHFQWCWLCHTEWTRDCMAAHWFS